MREVAVSYSLINGMLKRVFYDIPMQNILRNWAQLFSSFSFGNFYYTLIALRPQFLVHIPILTNTHPHPHTHTHAHSEESRSKDESIWKHLVFRIFLSSDFARNLNYEKKLIFRNYDRFAKKIQLANFFDFFSEHSDFTFLFMGGVLMPKRDGKEQKGKEQKGNKGRGRRIRTATTKKMEENVEDGSHHFFSLENN